MRTLTPFEVEVCANLGISAEDFLTAEDPNGQTLCPARQHETGLQGLSLCTERLTAASLPSESAELPAELMLVPPSLIVKGRDGRQWNNPSPQGIADYTNSRRADLPVDLEHSTELKAPQGESAPAVGWGRGLFVKPDGSVWARFTWTPRGRDLIANREYRYYSPVFIYDRRTNNLVGLSSVGLTNRPNLEFAALNSQRLYDCGTGYDLTEEERQVCERLGLNKLEFLQAKEEGP